MRKTRSISTFSLSFLDIMSCGLGAAVLIFLLLKHSTQVPVTQQQASLKSEINLLEEDIKQGQADLVRIRNTISEISDESVTAQGLARKIEEQINELKSVLEELAPDSDEDISGLKNKIAKLEAQKRALEKTKQGGNKAYEFTGDGQRQYLTGLKQGGEKVLILLDASASMLDETLVNIIRRRNMSAAKKRQSLKWQRARQISQWIIANLPLSSDFQVLVFNDEVRAADGNKVNNWHEVSDQNALSKNVNGVNKVVPSNGTNMAKVFNAAMSMTPRPDNIFLITDGLPTLGDKVSNKRTISGAQRLRLFYKASNIIRGGVPVNTLLLPLEGDPYAAAAFWQLAVNTRGAFLTPARDWP